MTKTVLACVLLSATFLASCSSSEAPLTESQQAEKYNMTIEQYKEVKDAAARMNMTVEQHLNMDHGSEMNHDMMDMSDDSHMIEDDMEMKKDMCSCYGVVRMLDHLISNSHIPYDNEVVVIIEVLRGLISSAMDRHIFGFDN